VLEVRFADRASHHRFDWSITTLTSKNFAEALARPAKDVAYLGSKLGTDEAICSFRHISSLSAGGIIIVTEMAPPQKPGHKKPVKNNAVHAGN
jgi:hypothetical protein